MIVPRLYYIGPTLPSHTYTSALFSFVGCYYKPIQLFNSAHLLFDDVNYDEKKNQTAKLQLITTNTYPLLN